MGLFDRAKNAFGGFDTLASAAQAQAAQRLASEHLAQAGYTDGSLPTAADGPALRAQLQADHDVLNAYGQELKRIIAIGSPGTGVITAAVDTGERTAGNAWFQLEVQVTLPGSAPYPVSKREMVAAQFAGNYAIGTAHDVAVDPADPQRIAFTS
jgi:hypothetical protein